jgi:hypothetical protein
MLGEEDATLNTTYHTTAQCISQKAALLVISTLDYRKSLENLPSQWGLMKKHSADKIMEFTQKLVLAEKSKNEIKKQQVTRDQ